MSRRLKDPLRALRAEEYRQLLRVSRSGSEPAEHVARAKALLAVAAGDNYTAAARRAGRRSNDAVSQLVRRFNAEGLAALLRRSGQGAKARYTVREREAILAEVRRLPEPTVDGTTSWSLGTLQRALRRQPMLSTISTQTIWTVLQEAGFRWVNNRSWCDTGQAKRRRKSGLVEVSDPDAQAKKKSHRPGVSRGRASGLDGVDTR